MLEHSQARVGRAQARDLTNLAAKSPIFVLVGGRERGGLGILCRRLTVGRR